MTLPLGILAGSVLGLLILSAFFSGSETALTASSKARLYELERRGEVRAGTVNRLLNMPERLIGSILLGNNLVNILASALATTLFLHLFGNAGVVYATLVMTALVLVFGEVMPKTYAIIYSEQAAMAVSPIIRILVAIFAPIVMAVEMIVKRSFVLMGVDITRAGNVLSAKEELRGAINLHHHEGAVVKKDRDMLGGILDLHELELSDLMVHRTNMMTIDASFSTDEVISAILASGFTRVPVWQDTPDNIIGILHAKELLKALQDNHGDTSKIVIVDICTKPWFVPDTTAVDAQLNAFLRRKMHFAIVVDEYGEMMGLITLEDIIEEIVGDIADEHDAATSDVHREASGSYLAKGEVPIRDINRMLDWSLPDDEVTTLAGLVIHEAQMIPDIGQAFTFHGFRFEVVRKHRNQLTNLRITPVK